MSAIGDVLTVIFGLLAVVCGYIGVATGNWIMAVPTALLVVCCYKISIRFPNNRI